MAACYKMSAFVDMRRHIATWNAGVTDTAASRILELIHKQGLTRPRDLEELGVYRTYLYRIVDQGLIVRMGRGLYIAVDAGVTEHYSMAEAA